LLRPPDIGLPDIPGDKVCQRIQELRPNIKVVVSTGHMVEDINDNLKIKVQGIIQKEIISAHDWQSFLPL